MTESNQASSSKPDLYEHPLYQAAMAHLAAGEEAEAADNLQQLIPLFPEEQRLRDLLVRAELKVAFADAQYKTERMQPGSCLRQILLVLLTMALILVGVTAVLALVDWLNEPNPEEERQAELEAALARGQQLEGSERWAEARDAVNQALALDPANAEALAALERIDQGQQLSQKYWSARAHIDRGEWQNALDLLYQLQASSQGYKDVESWVGYAQERLALEASLAEAQRLAAAGSWPEVDALLTPFYQQHPDFRRSEVEGLIFQANVEMARELLRQANADPEQIRRAIPIYGKALSLRPTDRNLIQERALAEDYVAGADAYARGDPLAAVESWESVSAIQPDFQGGVVRQRLCQAYPEAARALIAAANGDVDRLRTAIRYLDQALACQPGDEQLQEERRVAAEYVAGAEAFDQEEWDAAIARWGPLRNTRPDYQNGALASNLSEACANSKEPDATYCSP